MTGLILEGGGMRGAFTAGVLDAFLSENIHFDSVYGVSAGASNGASYISRQQGRNRKVFVDGVRNYKYFSFRNLSTQNSLLDINLLFDYYPNSLIPFDFETFDTAPGLFYTCLTECETGSPVYIERKEVSRHDFMMKVLTASNSLPLVSPPVEMDGRHYLDGGLSDSIPLKRAMADGCTRSVVILTREDGYRKKKSGMNPLIKATYRKYPEIASGFGRRHEMYNETIEFCSKCEKDGSALLIKPESTFDVSRTESDYEKLRKLYNLGIETGMKKAGEIMDFIRG